MSLVKNYSVYLDTVNKDFCLILFNEKYAPVYIKVQKDIKQKVELIYPSFQEALEKNGLTIQNIQNIYVNTGPGTFTGSRIGLVFAKTLAIENNIALYTANNFSIIGISNKNTHIYVDARNKKAYFGLLNKEFALKSAKIIDFENAGFSKPDFHILAYLFSHIKHIFTLETNLLAVQPFYLKEPNVGK